MLPFISGLLLVQFKPDPKVAALHAAFGCQGKHWFVKESLARLHPTNPWELR